VTPEDRMHRRVRDPGLAGDQPRAPASALARRQHALLDRCWCAPGRSTRTARAIASPTSRLTRSRRSGQPSPLPAMRRRARNAQALGGAPFWPSQLTHDINKPAATSRSEPRVSVRHPGPPACVSWRTPRTHRTGPDDFLAAHNLSRQLS
jgi:hypothetical protein